jgi:hypothetical protein
MPAPVWTINAGDITPSNSYASVNLVGCHITKNAAGTAYEFTQPNINLVLATAGPPLPNFPFSFPQFFYQGVDWNITVKTLAVGANVTGAWSTPGSPVDPHEIVPPQSGEFTAQSGSGVDEDAAASSAKA